MMLLSGQKESLSLVWGPPCLWKTRKMSESLTCLSKLALEIMSKEQGILLPPEKVSFIGSSLF